MNYAQLFADDRDLAAIHNRFNTWALVFLAVCALLPALGCSFFAYNSLQQNLRARAQCEGQTYPWDWAPPYQPAYASIEACRADRELFRGEAKDFGSIALGLFPLTLVFLGLSVGLRKRLPAALKVLRDRPQDVVWAHVLVVRGGGTDRYASINTAQRESFSLQLSTPEQCTDVVRRVGMLCPHATIGYTDDARARFNQDPNLLRR